MIDPSPKEKKTGPINEGFLAQKPLGGNVDLYELHNDVAPSAQNLKVVQFFLTDRMRTILKRTPRTGCP